MEPRSFYFLRQSRRFRQLILQMITLKTVERPEVNEDKVDETMRQVQLFFAEWKRMDGAIEENDFVLLDVDVIEEEPARPLFPMSVLKSLIVQWPSG